MLNNRGFTLIEVLASLVIICLITFLIVSFSRTTFSINKNKAYKIMKSNIQKATDNYIKECDNKILSCNLTWNENRTEFYANKLREAGYFKNLESPIDRKDIGNCLIIKVYKNNEQSIDIELEDNCY